MTILVVERDSSARATTRRLLESHGFIVLDADDMAAETLARLYVGPIHLVLIDVDPFGASGSPLVDRLRTLRPEPRVLFTSGRPRRELLAEGRLAARAAFIQKPCSARALASKIRTVLGRRSP